MKVSLPLLLVIGLVGLAASLPTNSIIKTTICSECEFTELKLTAEDVNNVKLVKLQNCLSAKKKAIAKSESEKTNRILNKRSAEEEQDDEPVVDTTTSFNDLFKVGAAFKRVLKQYLGLKQSLVKKTGELERKINKALVDFETADADFEAEPNMPTAKAQKSKPKSSCTERIRCEQPQTVIKVSQAVLTNKQHDKMCSALTHVLPLKLADMDETCYNKDEATKRLADMCDGESECEVSIALHFNTLCDCTDKKQLEIEYTCEPETAESKHSVSKRALYYQNNPQGIRQFDNFRDGILDYYDRLGVNYNYDYYGDYNYDCAYDYNYAYYYNYYDYYNGCGDYYGDYYGNAFTKNLAAKSTNLATNNNNNNRARQNRPQTPRNTQPLRQQTQRTQRATPVRRAPPARM